MACQHNPAPTRVGSKRATPWWVCGRPHDTRGPAETADSYQRSRRRSSRKSRLHHSISSKLAAHRHPNNTASSTKGGLSVDAQHQKTSNAAATTPVAKNVLAVRPVWHGPAGVCWKLGRSHDAYEPETWRAGSHSRKHCPAATAGSSSTCGLRCSPIAPRKSMQPLPR